jgi:hypothetical protein
MAYMRRVAWLIGCLAGACAAPDGGPVFGGPQIPTVEQDTDLPTDLAADDAPAEGATYRLNRGRRAAEVWSVGAWGGTSFWSMKETGRSTVVRRKPGHDRGDVFYSSPAGAHVSELAISPSYVFFIETSTDRHSLSRCPSTANACTSSNVQDIEVFELPLPPALAIDNLQIDGGDLYWVRHTEDGSDLYRMNFNVGGSVPQVVASLGSSVALLKVKDGHVVWTEVDADHQSTALYTCTATACTPTPLTIENDTVISLALDSAHVYWTTGKDRLRSIQLNGQWRQILADGIPWTRGLHVYRDRVFGLAWDGTHAILVTVEPDALNVAERNLGGVQGATSESLLAVDGASPGIVFAALVDMPPDFRHPATFYRLDLPR